MAKGLHNLIRLGEWQVDEKRRALGTLLTTVANMEGLLASLEAEIISEQAAATATPVEGGLIYGSYASAAIERRNNFHARIALVEEEITEAREELRLAYLDLKKYEIVQRQREEREAIERDREEQAYLDELGMQGHLRKDA